MSHQLRLGLGVISVLIAFVCTPCSAQATKQIPPSTSPGAAIESAAKAMAPHSHQIGAVDILTDTAGINFGPYLKSFLQRVRESWYERLPELAEQRTGQLAIEVTVQSDGRISDMKIVATSGDAILDRAAWDAIRDSKVFPKLPEGFPDPKLVLRCRFYYNPGKSDSTDYAWPPTQNSVRRAVLKQKTADSNVPEYPKSAIDAGMEGFVRLEANVGSDGQVTNARSLEGDPVLAESAIRAVQKWRFHPARKEGKKVKDVVQVKVQFRLDDQQVRTQVVFPNPDALVTAK